MIFLVWGLIILIAFLLTYIFYMKKEMLNISNQLNDYNKFKTEKKIDVNLINKEIEELAESINRHIEIANELRINEIKSKENLKEMIANISHDLRTPLTSIVGYIQIIKSKYTMNDKNIEYLCRVENKAKDLQEMLEDFFDLSVMESSEYSLTFEYVDINEILCDTLVCYYDELEKRNIEPSIDIKKVEKTIGDKKSIVRIIENLMSNTLKYSNGNVSIELNENDNNVNLTFMNSLEENKKIDTNRIFDKFYKNNDKSRSSKSTGLGLCIVKTLMEKMNGTVSSKQIENRLYITCSWKI